MKRASGFSAPPRPVPISLRVVTLLSGPLQVVGLALALPGLLVGALALGMSEVWDRGRFEEPLATAAGRVEAIDLTNTRINGEWVYRIGFTFQVEGSLRRATSYTRSLPAIGDPVVVEHTLRKPIVARIRGTSTGRFPAAFAWAVLPLPAIGLTLLLIGIWIARRRVWLLAHGEPALGRRAQWRLTLSKVKARTAIS